MDPDQAQHFIGPDLGPNCLQRLTADNKELKTLAKIIILGLLATVRLSLDDLFSFFLNFILIKL